MSALRRGASIVLPSTNEERTIAVHQYMTRRFSQKPDTLEGFAVLGVIVCLASGRNRFVSASVREKLRGRPLASAIGTVKLWSDRSIRDRTTYGLLEGDCEWPKSRLRDDPESGCRISWSSRCMSIYMKSKTPLFGPKHWRQRAEATRTKAESFACLKSRDRLLKIAEEYERLARHAEEWQTLREERDPESKREERDPESNHSSFLGTSRQNPR